MAPILFMDLFIVAAITVIGFAGGWCACGYKVRRQEKRRGEDRRLNQEMLSELRSVIDAVATDVGQHADCLDEINQGLAVAVTEEATLAAAAMAKLLMVNRRVRERLSTAESRLNEQTRAIMTHAAEARTDSLTRLVNRRAFDDELNRCFAAYRRQGRGFCVILLDLDHFRQWNERFGHPAGDQALSRVAALLRGNSREMDLVALYDGERFALILPGASLADTVCAAERLCAAVAVARFDNGDEEEAVLTLGGGVAQASSEDSVATLVARADAALAASKQAGLGRVHFHDGEEIRSSNSAKSISSGATRRGETPSAARADGVEPTTAGEGRTAPASPEPARPQSDVGEPPYLCARAEFRKTVGRRLAEWHRGGARVSVALVRIDDYQDALDEYGADVEPGMRSAVWNLVWRATRDMDLIGLYDQETFAMLLPSADRFAASTVAGRLREAVAERSLATPKGLLQFTVSVGVAEAGPQDQTNDLLQCADQALQQAVAAGGNRVFVHGVATQPDASEAASTAQTREQ